MTSYKRPDPTMIGARLRAEREATPYWSRGKLARLLRDAAHPRERDDIAHVQSLTDMIKHWENGKHVPGHRYRKLYSKVTGRTEQQLFGAQPEPAWQVEPVDHPVKDLAARVHALRLADDVLAGGDLIGPAFRELNAAIRTHDQLSHTEKSRRQVLSIIGEFAQIAGWIASDAGQHQRAADTYQLGITAAREAQDTTLESNLTGCLAYQTANIGDPTDAVALAVRAVEAAGDHAPPRARALAWDRLAWAHARAHSAQAATYALEQARAALADPCNSQPEPPYLYWVNAGELQIMEARTYTELHRPLRAVPLLTDVLSRYDSTHTRELALYLSWLAIALADANEPEQAAATAHRMLALSTEINSDRTAQRANTVLARLRAYHDVPDVQDLLAQYPATA